MGALSDEALVAACLEGESGAWAELVRRHAGLIYAIARRSGLAREDAEDAFQATFVLAWRNLGLLDRPKAVAGWIATIARREAWRLRQRRIGEASRTTSPESGVSDEIPAPGPLPDAAIERLERRARLEAAVDRLDERCRSLVRLLFLEDPAPSYAEAAERLGMPIGSLGPTRGRCLEKLREILDRAGWDVSAASPQDSTRRNG